MGDENPIRTLGDYSKPSQEGYRNAIELPIGNSVKDRKTLQRYPDVPTTSRRISLRSMNSFQGLTPKSPSSSHRSKARKEETTEAPSSQPIEYYLKHRINEKLIEGLVDKHRFNESLSRARVGKIIGRTYNLLPRVPVYEAILRKKITRKEDIGGNFKIPCNIGGLKHMNALVDQVSDMNALYLHETNPQRPAETEH
ncbi:hypothetical protein Tco_0516492 [Tanacetum coccineum]